MSSAPVRAGFQPHIQAVRALAVGLVVLYHLWPTRLTGGFVGVDVFFVISGYLISAHLVHESIAKQRVGLARFWARRARRLLPASLLVSLVSAVGVLVLAPSVLRQQFLREVAAGTLYVQNWALAHDAVDYLAKDNIASPVQHYWSLSVEEQFYLVWPLLIVLALFAVHRLSSSSSARLAAIAAVFGLVGVASFVWSVVETASTPGWAYFSTLTRAWEFALGGLLAVLHAALAQRPDRRLVVPPALATAGAYLGMILIVATAVRYDGQTPFPSWQAGVPVAGTLAMLAAGSPRHRVAPSAAYALRPVQWLGDVSYSVYLWHFPLIVLVPYALDHDLTLVDKLAVGTATLVLAGLTKVYVEDPVRTSSALSVRWRPRATYALTAVATAAVLAVSVVPWVHMQHQKHQREQQELAIRSGHIEQRCFGAAARLDPSCADKPAPDGFVPSLLTVGDDNNYVCHTAGPEADPLRCDGGAPLARSSTSVALVGNSHGMQLRGFLSATAKDRRWHVYDFSITGCAANFAVQVSLRGDDIDRCVEHNHAVVAWLKDHPEVSTLFVNNSTSPFVPRGGLDGTATAVQGYLDYWDALPRTVKHVVVIRDHPQMPKDFLECLSKASGSGPVKSEACKEPRSKAFRVDTAVDAAKRYDGDVDVIDMSKAYCDAHYCYPIIGGVLVYRNFGHVTGIWQVSLAPYVEKELDKVLPAASNHLQAGH